MKQNRWFIWTIVILFVTGIGLITYINYVSASDSALNIPSWIVHRSAGTSATKTQKKIQMAPPSTSRELPAFKGAPITSPTSAPKK